MTPRIRLGASSAGSSVEDAACWPSDDLELPRLFGEPGGARAVLKVIQGFRDKYTAEMVARLYPGPLNVAVKVKL
jgi:hypothetical protein